MLDPDQLALHTLTLRQLADAEHAADINDLPVEAVSTALDAAVEAGDAMAAKGQYMITPAGREKLDGLYPEAFAEFRSSDEVSAAMDDFEEGVNKQVLSLTTDWQAAEADDDRDKVITKLDRVVERTRKVLAPLASRDPLVERFTDRIGTALARAEAGETDYVSGVRVDSVHTVWFQMHEHILRLTGRERPE